MGALRSEILELKTVNEDKQSQIEYLREENKTGLAHLRISKEIISLKVAGKNCSLKIDKMLSERSRVQTIPSVDGQTRTDGIFEDLEKVNMKLKESLSGR
ncbi:hypothetical protein HHI36_010055 [Cryptolaemus montrouzieri]|uniref:Uncharacterized protein n=1 Tax=Cryptolaemus montrouzieri TaxID=559131 RepID=A0ABD2MHP0_9CUCU